MVSSDDSILNNHHAVPTLELIDIDIADHDSKSSALIDVSVLRTRPDERAAPFDATYIRMHE